MGKDSQWRRVAVIGAGPRGLGAIEALAAQRHAPVALDLFDPGCAPGAGPNFDPDQSPLCLLNIPLRAIDLPPASWRGARVPRFANWLPPERRQPERFPPRAELGGYLRARFRDLLAHAPDNLRLAWLPLPVTGLDHGPEGWRLMAADRVFGPYDEVLLVQGQPATGPDEQLARWQDHARRFGLDLLPAYPDRDILRAAPAWAGKTVAIRGLGLSTFDVLRLLTCGMGGRFENGRYIRSGAEAARILPFSLDGLAPFPKPADAALDARFDPTGPETDAFRLALGAALRQSPDRALDGLAEALVAPLRRILSQTGGDPGEAAIRDWLAAERDRPASQEPRDPVAALKAGIAMASGAAPPSIGHALGQLWRKWQDALRSGFNGADPAPGTAKALIGFDEGLKRYSYGPPVGSARELLALIGAGLVDLRAAEDPGILLREDGWQLVEDDLSARAEVMVDAVLPPPDPARLTDPLMRGLLDGGRICPVGKGMGLRTAPDGRVIGHDGNIGEGLGVLGRLAQGSVIAADSLHDCFGAATWRWSAGVASRVGRGFPAAHRGRSPD